jgi:hypothetical protein
MLRIAVVFFFRQSRTNLICVLFSAVQFEKLSLDKLGGVIVARNADCFAEGADGFNHEVNDFVKPGGIESALLNHKRVFDVLPYDFPVFLKYVRRFRFRSLPFRRLFLFRERRGGWGKDWNGMGIAQIGIVKFGIVSLISCSSSQPFLIDRPMRRFLSASGQQKTPEVFKTSGAMPETLPYNSKAD